MRVVTDVSMVVANTIYQMLVCAHNYGVSMIAVVYIATGFDLCPV